MGFWRLRPRSVKCTGAALALLLAALALGGCAGPQASGSSSQPVLVGGSTKRGSVASAEAQFTPPAAGAVTVTLETGKGAVKAVLYPEYAPLAVENFCTLASKGYYDGTAFHRVLAGFVVQGGAGTAGDESCWGTPFATERSNFLHHYSGALCMAAARGQPDTHVSQFYIVATPQDSLDSPALARLAAGGVRDAVVDAYRQAGGAPYLDNTDTVFGQVVEGMDIIDAMAAAAVEEDGHTPRAPVTVTSVKVENYTPLYIKGRPAYTPPVPQAPAEDVSSEAGEE